MKELKHRVDKDTFAMCCFSVIVTSHTCDTVCPCFDSDSIMQGDSPCESRLQDHRA